MQQTIRWVSRVFLWFGVCLGISLVSLTHAHALSKLELRDGIALAFDSEKCGVASDQFTGLRAEYESRGYDPVWVSDNGVSDTAKVLLAELGRSLAHGLKPEFYAHSVLQQLAQSGAAQELGCFDVLLTRAFVLYANDIGNGHIRSDNHPQHTIVKPVLYDAQQVMTKASSANELRSFLKTLLVTDDRYVRLISKLVEFLRINEQDAWPEIRNLGSAENPAVDPDRVRELLLFTGDLSLEKAAEASRGSEEYARAIARFQVRHGIEATGDINPATFQEMSLPLDRRIELIRINLERRRWQNLDLGQRHIYINLADQSVRFVRGGEKSGTARLKANERYGSLPTFVGEIHALSRNQEGELVLHARSNIAAGSVHDDVVGEFVVQGDVRRNLRHLLGDLDADGTSFDGANLIALENPVKTYVTYLTVWANKDGSINFRQDQHKRDRNVAELLKIAPLQ